jgi:hypothetical protein
MFDFIYDHAKAFLATAALSITVGAGLIIADLSGTSAPAFGSTAYIQNTIAKHPDSAYWELLSNGSADMGMFGSSMSTHKQVELFTDAVRYCNDDLADDPLHATCEKIITVANQPDLF